ncbi:hypothetical protein GOD90_24300 [Sinorhizobium medicae]|nr:hypothetical protein [Sinorhizobium medicae]MDX0900059.1 hypothetical protein [Sinorhizobium medicae]MDX1045403.1 hypothetical protein [Sinorhizobium medicae]MDX1119772.1 hypothetical protein [Sinorhizobium medicae]MDX1132027.1 hypothetical protein [Sinorhizobium medicae]
MSDEEREAMRVAFCEQEEEWRAALDAYHNKPGPRRLERLAAEWILIFNHRGPTRGRGGGLDLPERPSGTGGPPQREKSGKSKHPPCDFFQ